MDVNEMPERLRRKISVTESGCWEWTGFVNNLGYGIIQIDLVKSRVHRLTYQIAVGEIPDEYHVDHLCRNRRCCNPAHLEAVTELVNLARSTGRGQAGIRSRMLTGLCPRGHDNWGRDKRRPNSHYCRSCKNAALRLKRQEARRSAR